MSEHERKRAHDDLPAVHLPAHGAGKSGRDTPAKTAAMEREELQRLTGRLRNARNAAERAALLAAIEHRFGSATADRVVAELGRHDAGTDEPGHAPHRKGPA